MVLGTTTTAQVINPQVMADMVSAKLPKLIKFTPLAVVETTLVGRPGERHNGLTLVMPLKSLKANQSQSTNLGLKRQEDIFSFRLWLWKCWRVPRY